MLLLLIPSLIMQPAKAKTQNLRLLAKVWPYRHNAFYLNIIHLDILLLLFDKCGRATYGNELLTPKKMPFYYLITNRELRRLSNVINQTVG